MTVAPNDQRMKINKTEEEYNMKSIRFLLLTITTMFLLIAALMIVLGISVYSHFHSFTFFYESTINGHFVTPSVLCVFLGVVLTIASLFGFFGSLKQSTCMVNFYAFYLTLILIVQLVIVIVAFTLGEEKVVKYMYFPVGDYATDSEVQAEVDAIQTRLSCCGGNSYLDYLGMEFTSNHSTVVVSKQNIYGDYVTMVIPSSCCASSGEVFCSRMWASPCKAALADVLIQNSTVIGVLGVSVMFINLLGIIFALLLARCIRKMKSQRTLQMWKIREQIIMARNAEEAMRKADNHVYIQEQASSAA